MAGLYGPGRIPRRQEIAAGLPLAVPVDGYLNLIHVDDAVSAVVAADARATPPRTYIVSDGHPVIRRAYYEELAHLLAGAPPKFAPPADESAALARSRVDKRVSNARLLRELEVPIAYPSYREGLAAIVAAENNRTPPTA
jgi:nucleoside-diphosphate-sugar epimerase